MRLLSSRSVRVGLALFIALCLYVPWRVDRWPCPYPSDLLCGPGSGGYHLIFAHSDFGAVDLTQWLLGVLALGAAVTLSYWHERRPRG